MAKYEIFMNLYPNYQYTLYQTKELADKYADLNRIECRKIEWESKEPTRVADYFVPEPKISWVADMSLWSKRTHPIGSQPEGSVLVPGSERSQE